MATAESNSPGSEDARATAAATSTTNVKRKLSCQSAASGRTVKRRAPRACHCCRARKVRCDVVESGTPCTNCRLDEVECVVSDSKRKKRPRAAAADVDHPRQSPASSHDSEEFRAFASYEDMGVEDMPSALDDLLAADPPGSLAFESIQHVPHMLCQLPRLLRSCCS